MLVYLWLKLDQSKVVLFKRCVCKCFNRSLLWTASKVIQGVLEAFLQLGQRARFLLYPY